MAEEDEESMETWICICDGILAEEVEVAVKPECLKMFWDESGSTPSAAAAGSKAPPLSQIAQKQEMEYPRPSLGRTVERVTLRTTNPASASAMDPLSPLTHAKEMQPVPAANFRSKISNPGSSSSILAKMQEYPALSKCKLCGKIVRSRKHMYVHMPGSFSCPFCPCVYTRSDNLTAHIKRKHEDL